VTALIAVVLNWNGGADTLRCLQSLAGVDTIVVDNGSTDGSDIEVERRFPDVELIRAGANLGYAGGNNLGVSRAFERGAAWTLLVNNDGWIDRGLPAALATAAVERPDAGVLACKVYSAEQPDVLTYAGGNVRLRCGYNGRQVGAGVQDEGQYDVLRDVRRAIGAAMAVLRRPSSGPASLDERLFAYVEDVEWCVRIRSAGFAASSSPTRRCGIAARRRPGVQRRPSTSTRRRATRFTSASSMRRCRRDCAALVAGSCSARTCCTRFRTRIRGRRSAPCWPVGRTRGEAVSELAIRRTDRQPTRPVLGVRSR
jgi:GT2 family glycosyltransferase